MQNRPFKHESVLYLIAFILAAALRFIQLGTLPLSDIEAKWALQALNVALGNRPLLGSQTGYTLPTSALFFLFGSSNFLARFIPALTGSMLVFVPKLFRERLKPVPTLLLAFFLALDPGLVSLSRQAGSLIPALTFFLLAWGFWRNERSRLAGVFAGLALLSGPFVWMGVASLGVAWGLERLVEWGSVKDDESDDIREADEDQDGSGRKKLKDTLIFGGMTILLAGTMFFLSPNGLSAWLNSLPEYLAGWVQPSGVPMGRLLFALLTYQPLAIVLGLIAIFRGRSQKLMLWLLGALIVTLFYPARQVGDLAWVVIPLWVLAAIEISNYLDICPEERREVTGVILLIVILLVFSWLNYATIALDPNSPLNTTTNTIRMGDKVLIERVPPTRYLLLIGVLLLMVISVMLVALGWSVRTAILGSVWGTVIALGIYSLGMTVSATGLRTPDGWELWWPDRRPAQAVWLLSTINEQSEWSTGNAEAQTVTLLDINSPALEWLLRERTVEKVFALDSQEAPAIIISDASLESPNLPIAYRGQDFTWRQSPSWNALIASDWVKWSVFRNIPYDSEAVIVWVRNDLFIDTNPSLP